MKKLTFLCVAVMITAALIFKAENSFSQVYQLENSDFEDWPGGATTEPTGWNSFESLIPQHFSLTIFISS